ncbi:hypothetical protein LDENG_00249540 [Lucifuga dentata]|nr:hypothetical protein LDENG_00249540 [Lucifuga dentata]
MDEEDREDPCDVVSDRCGQPEDNRASSHRTDEDTDDEGTGEETFRDEDIPPDLQWLEELYEEDSDGDLAVAADNVGKKSYGETVRMFKLRRNLDQLDCFHQQKEHDVVKTREELKLCCQNIEGLLEQRSNVEEEIERQKAADNSAAAFRLRAQHKRLCQELQREEELQARINAKLKQQELELCELEVELGRFSSLRQEVQEEERFFQTLKAQKAATRLQQEQKANQNLQLKMQHLREKQEVVLKREEMQRQKQTEEFLESRKKAAKFLKQTIKRMHQREAEKEQQSRELLQKRTQAVMSLKSNIAAIHESLRVQQSRAKASSQQKEHQQRRLRESLQAAGVNSTKTMYQQKRLEEVQRKQQQREERQKSKRVEIVAKILQEEQLVARRKALPPKATANKAPNLWRASEELLCYLDDNPPSAVQEGVRNQLREFSDTSSSSSATSDPEDSEEAAYREGEQQSLPDSLAEPEFSGLWEQNYKETLDVKEESDMKLEVPVMATDKLNVPVKKVFGKKQKGSPFISKPELILFKDFDVGKTYKKKISLTNISYTTNYCKLLGVSAGLRDFISVRSDFYRVKR